MNDRMRECLVRAVHERREASGAAPFPDRLRARGFTPERLIERSLAHGAEGFQLSTIWRALELATEDES